MRLKHIAVLYLFMPLFGRAQDVFINKGSAVYIQYGGLIEVWGNLVNDTSKGAGSISNDGTIEVTGNFENNSGAAFGVYNNNSSTERAVKFTGTGKQLIEGQMSTAGTASFYNLVMDQFSTKDTVEMQTAVVLTGSLVFGSGNTTTTYNPSNLYTNNSGKGLLKTFNASLGEFLLDIQNGDADAVAGYPALVIGGAPASGFVLTSGIRGSSSGGLQRAINTATSYLWPIGTIDEGFNGVQLNFTAVPGGGSVKSKFCTGSSNPSGTVGTLSTYCNGCEGNYQVPNMPGYNRFYTSSSCNGGAPQWIIFEQTATNGYWSFASTNTGYTYDMEVFPNTVGAYTNPSATWRVLKYEASYGTDPSVASVDWTSSIESTISSPNDLLTYTKNAGCYSGSGVPGGLYTDFSQFTMGGTGGSNALPVKLLYITATGEGKHHILVSWATALEINNAGFEVMRSEDGVDFTDIGWVNGHDNSTVTENYTYDDKVSQENIPYYYKLRQVDNNGNFEYSNVAEATVGGANSTGFALFPNPTSNTVFLAVDNPADVIDVTLFDIQGRQVYQNIFTVAQAGASQTVSINASSVLPPGTYILAASTNGTRFSDKVILQ